MEPRISIVTLGVADLARSRRFYGPGLGWRESSAGSGAIAFSQTGGIVLTLFPRAALAEGAGLADGGSGSGGIALACTVRRREEVAAVLEEAGAAGATILEPAQDTSWGGHAGYFVDPDGYPWEAARNPRLPPDADGRVRLPE